MMFQKILLLQIKLAQIDLVLALKIYYLVTLFYFFYKKCKSKFLLLILLLAVINTILTTVFVNYKISLAAITNLYILVHDFLWLYMINKIVFENKYYVLPAVFLIYGLVNLFFAEGFDIFNSDTFIFGSFLYVLTLFYASYMHLKNENLAFFFQNTYLLFAAPVMFFISYSLVFAFSNKTLNSTILFYGISLFNLVNLFANFIYYSLINLYIYRAHKITNEL